VVAVPFFGDGGSNEGVVHETMNMAAIWNLPMVFVCENNMYAISASWKEMGSVDDVSERAAAYGMRGETVDGMDVEVVHEAASRLVERARRGEGPALLECNTYRFVGHYTAEAALGIKYRSDEEIEAWRTKDPIPGMARVLVERGVLDEAGVARVDDGIEEELDAAVAFAEKSPWPDLEEAYEHMYSAEHPNAPVRGWET